LGRIPKNRITDIYQSFLDAFVSLQNATDKKRQRQPGGGKGELLK